MLHAKDLLAELLDQVEETLKVIESGVIDVTPDVVAVVRLRDLAKKIDAAWGEISDA